MSHPIERRFLVHGLVQGVGYRYFAQRAAQRHHLVGFVRNLPDGSVEAVAQGKPLALEQFEQELRQGPPFSSVEEIERMEVRPEQSYTEFRIAR